MALFPTVDTAIYTVTELTAILKQLIGGRFRNVRVEGEVSNAKLYPSGHLYFTLKDDTAMMKAVAFNHRGKFSGKPLLKDGDTVVCEGRIDVYEKRGEYQLIVADMTVKTDQGNLYLQFLALKEKLFKEGLFDETRKKPLPLLPRRLGIVTSPVGAAIRDMLRIIYSKFPNMSVVIYPVKVQGEEASAEIAQGIHYLDTAENVDVIIVGRGGGSLEDLACFNAENVARAICACVTPVVSAVGHEIDFTIADFAADVRAPTPTAAADMTVPDKNDIRGAIEAFKNGLAQNMKNRIERAKFLFYHNAAELRERKDFFASHSMYLDDLAASLMHGVSNYMRDTRKKVEGLSQRIEDLNPDNILKRGYSVTQKKQTGEIVLDSSWVEKDENLVVSLFKGRLEVVVRERTKR
ncbi:MAG TPA: exodeoxyribonuclease VII large subunit [Syntrophorhabdaceae bacterium]|nr:exodeoxyribonuclease VII large subunit [Syntrophorhabdaceae bacterium]